MKKNYEELAKSIIDNVGGASNVQSGFHCATRLRLNLVDKGFINEEEIKKIPGVLGIKWLGEQIQIIIGQDVKFVYNELIKMKVIESEEKSNEKNTEKLTLKRAWSATLGYISSSMSTLIPILIGAGLCKTIAIVLGPDLLNVLPATTDFYYLLTMIHNALMYFLPALLGYTTCKALGINPLYGIFLGLMLVAPGFREMIGVRETFSVYFFNAPVADYSTAFLPIILIGPILKFVNQFLEKHMPKMFSIILVPLLTILVMIPVLFLVCGPIGNYIGTGIGSLFSGISEGSIIIRIIGTTVLCMAWPYLILFGMHIPVVQLALFSLLTVGYDMIIWPTAIAYSFVIMGVGLGAVLKNKNKDERGIAISASITSIIGGLTEPVMYGIIMRYKKGFLATMIACGIGGLLCGIFAPAVFNLAGLYNIITLPIAFVGGSTTSYFYGTAILVISLIVGAISSYFIIDYKHKL